MLGASDKADNCWDWKICGLMVIVRSLEHKVVNRDGDPVNPRGSFSAPVT